MDEKRFLLARLIRQGLREVFEGVRELLPEGERQRAEKRLAQYMALDDRELCWLLDDLIEKGSAAVNPLADEASLHLLALDLAATLLDLPMEIRAALKDQLAQHLGFPSA